MSKNYTPVRLAYDKFEPEGCDSSTPVIFLHGLSATKQFWGEIPKIVANNSKRKVYVVDARNHGDSEWSDEFNFDINVEDLLHFMDTVGEEKVILVGHSMGGVTAMKAALKKPERIERIIIEDMHAKKFRLESLALLTVYMMHLQSVVHSIPPELGEEEAKLFCGKQFSQTLPNEVKELEEKESGEIKPQHFFALKRDSSGQWINKTNFDALILALMEFDAVQSELSGRYDGPAHFIYGKASSLKVYEDADHVKQFFPRAEFTGIENATHDVHEDKPKEFTDALLKSLS